MKKKKLLIIVSVIVVVAIASTILFLFRDNLFNIKEGSETETTIAASADEYTVNFYSNDDAILKSDTVSENSPAIPPDAPAMEYGSVFQSWDTDFSDVTQDLNIRPIYESVKGQKNVIAVHSAYAQNDSTVMVPVQLCGDVCVSGFDITIKYDSNSLQLESIDEDKAVVYNDQTPGTIKLNYVSTKNTVADVDVCNLYFKTLASDVEVPIDVEIKSICAFDEAEDNTSDKLITPESSVINGKVYIVG